MKKILLLAVLAIITMVSCKKSNEVLPTEMQTVINEATVPVAVRTAFNTNYSGATQVEWRSASSSSSNNSQEFEVEFNHQSQRHISRLDDKGSQKSHSISCSSGPVPQNVLTAFRATHPTEVVTEWKLRNDGTWKAHYLKGTIVWEATYTAAGVLVKDELA
jgi:hypothetical protein